jgi:tetratricopeptide (TPR) repeat protein
MGGKSVNAIENGLSTAPPVLAYAAMLRKNDQLIAAGNGDGEEAALLADDMDGPWYAMTDDERDRMRGLSADLYALREGGPKRIEMSDEEQAKWQQARRDAHARLEIGDVDAALSSLRLPIPSNVENYNVPFLQARCWEKLGDFDTALEFMKEAERRDPRFALLVLSLLEHLHRAEEVGVYVNRILLDDQSTPLALWYAAAVLLGSTITMKAADAKPILQRLIKVLARAQELYLALKPEHRELLNLDADIALALGQCHERLGEQRAAIQVYDKALASHKADAGLYMARGLARFDSESSAALTDLTQAVRLRVTSILPYAILAHHALEQGALGDALTWANIACQQPGPDQTRAEVYETIAIALAKLGQRQEWILENFDKALAFDPLNERIKQNRNIALALSQSASKKPRSLAMWRLESKQFWNARNREIANRLERLSEERSNFLSREALALPDAFAGVA